jgi:uncharacterized protein (DUF1800 family)
MSARLTVSVRAVGGALVVHEARARTTIAELKLPAKRCTTVARVIGVRRDEPADISTLLKTNDRSA